MSRLTDEIMNFWLAVHEYDGFMAREIHNLYKRLQGREEFCKEQLELFCKRADKCARDVTRLTRTMDDWRAQREGGVQRPEEIGVEQPSGDRPASSGGEELPRSPERLRFAATRDNFELERERYDRSIRDDLRRCGRRQLGDVSPPRLGLRAEAHGGAARGREGARAQRPDADAGGAPDPRRGRSRATAPG